MHPQIFVLIIWSPISITKQDLAIVKEIGRGAYGVVEKCLHQPSNVLVAVKRILLTMDETERRRLMMDLEINRLVRGHTHQE